MDDIRQDAGVCCSSVFGEKLKNANYRYGDVFTMNGSAWFVIRNKKTMEPLDVNVECREGMEVAFAGGRAARKAKQQMELHPCSQVEIEFMGIEDVSEG